MTCYKREWQLDNRDIGGLMAVQLAVYRRGLPPVAESYAQDGQACFRWRQPSLKPNPLHLILREPILGAVIELCGAR